MRSLLHLLHLLLFIIVSSSLAQSQHQDIDRSIDILKSAGVVGLDRLCHPSNDLGIPKCRTESEFSSIHLRGSRYLMHSTRDTSSVMRRRLAEDKEEHNANFYIINIGGTVIRYAIFSFCMYHQLDLQFVTNIISHFTQQSVFCSSH
jgi:hypothetical protein